MLLLSCALLPTNPLASMQCTSALLGLWLVQSSCPTLCHLLFARYQGHVSAALVLGGVDVRGPHLFTVYPHGSTDALPYATMGSGSLNAMAVFEDGFRCTSSFHICI